MSDELRSTTFKVNQPVMGYVEGEEPTILDLDEERETEYLEDGSLEYVSGDSPRIVLEKEEAEAAEAGTDYKDMTVDQLKALVEKRDLTVEGTGSNGNVLKEDYIEALEAADEKGDN